MLYLGTTPLAGKIKSKLFTSSSTFVVPADVYCIWVDGCGSGSGGGGGDPTPGGGGGGGGAALACKGLMLPTTPGETWTIAIPAGGAAGSPGQNGSDGGQTTITGSDTIVRLNLVGGSGVGGGRKGTASAGGDAGTPVPYGAAGTSYRIATLAATLPNYMPVEFVNAATISYFPATNGGALNVAGGARTAAAIGGGIYTAAAAGGAAGGGGGHGAIGPFTSIPPGGVGGSNGAAGTAAGGYGCGGGGGSGNAAGGAGSPGFLRLFMITAYSI